MAKVKPDPTLISKGNPEWTKADFARAKPLAEALPELAVEAKRTNRPRSENPNEAGLNSSAKADSDGSRN